MPDATRRPQVVRKLFSDVLDALSRASDAFSTEGTIRISLEETRRYGWNVDWAEGLEALAGKLQNRLAEDRQIQHRQIVVTGGPFFLDVSLRPSEHAYPGAVSRKLNPSEDGPRQAQAQPRVTPEAIPHVGMDEL